MLLQFVKGDRTHLGRLGNVELAPDVDDDESQASQPGDNANADQLTLVSVNEPPNVLFHTFYLLKYVSGVHPHYNRCCFCESLGAM